MKKLFYLIPIILLMAAGCSDSNSPTKEDGLYTYSHIEEEIIEVYGEGGEKLSENEWNEIVNTAMAEFDETLEFNKLISFKLNENSIEAFNGNESTTAPYIMKGDTIVGLIISGNDTLELDMALQIDKNTIELHLYSFVIRKQGKGTELESGSNIGGYEEILQPLMQEIPALKSDEYIAAFLRKIQYKK